MIRPARRRSETGGAIGTDRHFACVPGPMTRWFGDTSCRMGLSMPPPRRFLPALSMLTAFEAASRTGSITAAAQELNLTQSAVSRQILALEEQLETKLFVRERRRIRVTLAGETYAREIREALNKIADASLNLRANPAGGTLNLAILPTFGTRWLAPRLPRFLRDHGGVTINLATRSQRFDFALDTADAAIHFGGDDWPNVETAFIRDEAVVPVCSPDFARRHPVATPEDLRGLTLLHLTSRPDAWEHWFRAQGAAAEGIHGMLFDQFATIAGAATAGLGVALLPDFLFDEELAAGTLVRILDRPLKSAGAYHLVWPIGRANHPPLAAFRDWLAQETAADLAARRASLTPALPRDGADAET